MEEKIVEEKPKKKKKNIILLYLKKHKIKTLLFLFLALVANTYAWFLYNRVVSANLNAHIKSWQVTIDGAMDDTLTFNIEDLYPGMPDYSDAVQITNEGEMDATVTFTLKSIRILDDTYEVGVNGETVQSLNERLDDYPFEISMESSNSSISGHGGTADLRLYITWDFGNGDEDEDALDTYWGEKSYDFHVDNPTESSLEIVIDVNVAQINNP